MIKNDPKIADGGAGTFESTSSSPDRAIDPSTTKPMAAAAPGLYRNVSTTTHTLKDGTQFPPHPAEGSERELDDEDVERLSRFGHIHKLA